MFGIFTWDPINMEFIAFNTWILLPFNQWYHRKLKINIRTWTFVEYDYFKK